MDKNIEKDLFNIRLHIFTQNNYYTRELERIIEKIQLEFGLINVRNLNNEENKKIFKLYSFVRDLNFKDIYNDSMILLDADELKEELRLKNVKKHLKTIGKE